MIALIDNYDSFTHNLRHLLICAGIDVNVYQNNSISCETLRSLKPSGIVLSPGPGVPKDAGICLEVIREFSGQVPILGICLGHQSIAEAFGGRLIHAPSLVHGQTAIIEHGGTGLFQSVPQPFKATRYHSWVVDSDSLPSDLIATAWNQAPSSERCLMGLRHKTHPTFGLQFHPEAILSEHGEQLISNFLSTRSTHKDADLKL